MLKASLDSSWSSGTQLRSGCASVRIRSIMCGWCSSKAGRSDRIRGSEVKLCRGGGELVAHSSEVPYPHGSSAGGTSPYFSDRNTFQMNGSVDAPRINEPMVENVFRNVKPSE